MEKLCVFCKHFDWAKAEETAKEIAAITGNAFEQRDKNGDLIDPDAPNRTQYEATMIAMGAQEASQIIAPKRRGRPKGSRNKPKV